MKKREKKNKGFSLVELIVVVLIIGVIGIALAPQVMKWVDTSKINTDVNNAESLQASVQAALADWQNDGGKMSTETSDAVYIITSAGSITGGPSTGQWEADGNTLLSYIEQVTGGDYPKSKYDANGYTIRVTSAGKVTVTCNAQHPGATPTPVPGVTPGA